MISSLLNAMFGCSHKRTTFPITRRQKGTYVVCLECGHEFRYDWKEMRIDTLVLADAPVQPSLNHQVN